MTEPKNQSVHLSFTIGPVQAFVAQARRTRDLWAGSWLLSYLAETALAVAEKTGGHAVIPHRHENQRGTVTSISSPIGGYPNRFELSFDSKDDAKLAAKNATEAFQEAWKKVAVAVWDKYVKLAAEQGNGTEAIWDRQIENFWEITWVVGVPTDDAKTIAHLAAARKNIRNVNATLEPGIKCSLMGTLQEISGQYGQGARNKQVAFWEKLQHGLGALDIKKGERLCAIALIKRLFPHVIEEAVIGNIHHELTEQESWPSTAFLAALPWLKKVEQSAISEAEAYACFAKEAGWKNNESQAAKDSGLQSDWAQLDGPAWFAGAVRQNEPQAKSERVHEMLSQLKTLYDKVDRKPVPYYAMLLMDGDSMGKLVATLESPQDVSKGLSQFSEAVEDVVKRHDGRTIYAGGDDVLAIVPAEMALAAADELAQKYTACFDGISEATLSGAIVYAHWKHPLRQVLQTAHHLLDDIAKNRTGRDSLAIGIIQGCGLQAIWSAPWTVVRGDQSVKNGFGQLEEFIHSFGSDSTNKETTEFNASFLYLLRQQFGKFFTEPAEQPGQFGTISIGSELLVDLANSEYRRRMKKCKRSSRPASQTIEIVKPLLAISQRWERDSTTHQAVSFPETFSFDGWRVARFLKQVKDGKVDDHE